MFDNSDPVILFRMGERLTLTLVVILVALVVMVGFWKSVQKVDLTQGGSLGVAGSFMFSTPVFVLLTVVGYAYVSLSHPISVGGDGPSVAEEAPEVAQADGARTFLGAANDGVTRTASDYARTVALRRVRSLNCLAEGRVLSARLEDDLRAVKLDLMQGVWADGWGDPAAFAGWVEGTATDAPAAAAVRVFDDRHVAC